MVQLLQTGLDDLAQYILVPVHLLPDVLEIPVLLPPLHFHLLLVFVDLLVEMPDGGCGVLGDQEFLLDIGFVCAQLVHSDLGFLLHSLLFAGSHFGWVIGLGLGFG